MSTSDSASGSGSSSSVRSRDLGVNRMIMMSRRRSNRMKDHKCELMTASTDDINKLYPLSFMRRFQQRIHKSILVAGSNKRSQKYLRSSAAVCFEEERQLVSPHWYIIHPFSEFRVIWQCLISVALLFYVIFYPFVLSFITSTGHGQYLVQWYLVNHMTNLLFMVNIGLTFITGIVEKKTRQIILDPWIIARNYLHGIFWIDLITSIPWDLAIFFVPASDRDAFFWTLVLVAAISLLVFYRVIMFIHIMGELFEVAGLSETLFRLMSLLVRYLMFLHWAACAEYLVPFLCHGDEIKFVPASWLVMYNMLKPDALVPKYLNSWSRAISVSLKLGYGRYIQIQSPEDAIVCSTILIIGFFHNAVVFGVFLHFLASRFTSDLKYQSSMIQLREYMRYKKLPRATQQRLLMYYENKFQKGYFKETDILGTLSESLREEIKMHCCHRLVSEVELFSGLPPSILASIIGKLLPEICLPTDVIVKAGMPGDCMYFLQIGTAAVFTATGKEICHLQDGDYFGEIVLLEKNARRVASVIAVDICEVYRLDRTDFLECIASQPHLLERIEKLAKLRKEETLLAEDQYTRKLKESFTTTPMT